MKPSKEAIIFLRTALGEEEAVNVLTLSQCQEDLESKWNRTLKRFFNKLNADILEALERTGQIDESVINFGDFFFDQAFDVSKKAISDAKNSRLPPVTKSDTKKLVVYPKGKIPNTLRALRTWYDSFKKKGVVPPRQRKLAEEAKRRYLKKVKSVWEKYSQDFRNGTSADKQDITKRIRKAADTEYSRAQTIVNTETTHYYNATRRAIYDQSDDITHYLFVAIRDWRTTKWCKTRTGLVYKKGTEYLEKETPDIHWNCRSEILPLSPLNPRHAALIADKSKARENNSCEPLPPEWNKK